MLKYDPSQLDYMALLAESQNGGPPAALKTARFAILTDAAPQYFSPVLKALCLKSGIRPEIYEAEYDTIELEISNPSSGLYAFKPDFILIFNSVNALRNRFDQAASPAGFAETTVEKMAGLWDALKSNSSAAVVPSNFPVPYERLFGSADRKFGYSFSRAVRDINARLAERARDFTNVHVSDIDELSSWVGRERWFDEKMWVLCKAYCAFDFLPHAVQSALDVVLSLRGAGVKCVVLDLDNTLWGGIIGDDGLEGIRIGHYEDGEAFSSFQHFIRDLKERGILLAICSKNDPENALKPFREHPDMVLKESDITVFVANWVSKAENIKTIREALNIGYDSMVFLDDNSFERGLVREMLPDVIVPELPEDPALYVQYLSSLNLFETTAYSETDAGRAEMYRAEAGRKIASMSFTNPQDYLHSLEMKIAVKRFDKFHLPRIAQLIQRSNQFNLRTRRFTESQCEALMNDEAGHYPFHVSLRDKYGDSGLISVVVLKSEPEDVIIEEWIMSCRVLARGVEEYTMNHVVDHARRLGKKHVRGVYAPTDKNKMVKEFFAGFGFRKESESESGETHWTLDVAAYKPRETFMEAES